MKTIFKPFTKSMSSMFKEFVKSGTVQVSTMVKYLGNKTLRQLKRLIIKSGALKYIEKMPGWIDDIISALKRFRSWAKDSWFFKWLRNPLTWMIDKLFKILKRASVLFLQVITEMSLYDPTVTRNAITWIGEKIGLDEITSTFGEWVEKDSVFRNKWLLSSWNSALEISGSIEGVIETTVFDCKGGTYDMDIVVTEFLKEHAEDTNLWDIEGFKKFVPNQPLYQSKSDGSPRWDIRKASRKWDGFSWGQLNREIEKWWKKGWRPNVYAGIELGENQPTDEMFYRQYRRYANNSEIIEILNGEGIKSCEEFVTWIKALKKTELGIIHEMECIDNPEGFGCGDDDDGNMFGD